MSNEITLTAKLSIAKDGQTITGDITKIITLTGNGKYSNVQSIPDSDTQVTFAADVVTEGVGLIWLRNLDGTKYVDIKQNVSGTKHTYARIKPGEVMVLRTAKTATNNPDIWAAAETGATIKLMVVATGT